MGEILHELARRKGGAIEEGHLMPDHIHICISIPSKYAVSNIKSQSLWVYIRNQEKADEQLRLGI